ncbi:winged helix-turn-helix domain-containing protein [candidate division KSB1 bacterium]|nr:winged helix-turn-helix domain-containing protein [candidate division KSB1 bacterium]
MLREIGELSGIVWRLLKANGEMTTAAIKKETNQSDFMVGAAVGWLAREDKLNFKKSARIIKVSLK